MEAARLSNCRTAWTVDGNKPNRKKKSVKWDTNTVIESRVREQEIDFALSAAYVQDALNGRYYKSGLGRNMSRNRKISLWCFHIHTSTAYNVFFIIVTTFHSLLAFFEPAQMIAVAPPSLPIWVVLCGLLSASVYIIDVTLSLAYRSKRNFVSFVHCKLYILLVLFISSDYVIYFSSGRMIFRLFRPCILLVRLRGLRGTGLVMLGVIPKFLLFLCIMGIYIAIFAVVGVHLFLPFYLKKEIKEDEASKIYFGSFNNIGIAVLRVFVVMTGGNYPLIMFPAYDDVKSLSLIYFVTVILTGQLVLYGIMIARIFDFYVEANKKYVKKERFQERQCLIKAFETMDQENEGRLSYSCWKGLMAALLPKATEIEIRKRFEKMKELAGKEDNNNNSAEKFTLIEFFYLHDVLQFIVEKKKSKSDSIEEIESQSRLKRYWHGTKNHAKTWSSSGFGYSTAVFFNILFLAAFALVWWGMTPMTSRVIFGLEFGILTLLCIDVLLRLIAAEQKHEIGAYAGMVGIAVACMFYIYIVGKSHKASKGWAAILAHLALIVRLTGFRRNSASLFHWIRRMIPPICTLGYLTMIGLYTYGIVGMEMFSYLSLTNETDVMPRGISLCRYGFETLACSLLTLLQISLGSSWHRVMNYVMNEVSPWSAIYFVFLYAMMQMVVLNVISAVMVELSNAIYSDEAREKEQRKDRDRRKKASLSSPYLYSKRTRNKASLTNAFAMTTQVAALGRGVKQPTPNFVRRESSLTNTTSSQATDQPKMENASPDTDVRLSGRKVQGNWTREIAPQMTFLNAEELRRHLEEMGMAAQSLRVRQESRKRNHSGHVTERKTS